ELLFTGDNEFRRFNTKTFRYRTDHVADASNIANNWNIYLEQDTYRKFKIYTTWSDLNGKFFITTDIDSASAVYTADYCTVHFSLYSDYPEPNGRIFLIGAFNNWKLDIPMEYDFDTKTHKAQILLKQGYYDYTYCYVDTRDFKPNYIYVDGSHWQTENDYVILTYIYDIQSNADLLLGYTVINTKKK
ncbi:MAG: hypothetical protein SNJ71_03965, partial [Bacteroidales bacterium]